MAEPTAVTVYGVDVGNSRVKLVEILASKGSKPSPQSLGLGKHRTFLRAPTGSCPGDGELDQQLVQQLVASLSFPARLHLVSVDPKLNEHIREAFQDQPAELLFWDSYNLPLEHPYADASELGADRLLAAWASHKLVGGPVIVVDAGTALTVDLVDKDGRFAGGAIAPGLSLAARSLASAGAMLVDVVPVPPLVYPGQSRRGSLEAGLLASFLGGAERLVDEGRRCAPEAKLMITGGDGGILAQEWAARFPQLHHEPKLLEIGLAELEWRQHGQD
ncbi:MAG: type III pantothenate kinase [Planctomycetota bacterium]